MASRHDDRTREMIAGAGAPVLPAGIVAATRNYYHPLDVSQLANVPKELQNGKLFVCWRTEIRNRKPTKVPVNPHTGNEAESNNPATWSTLGEAISFYQTYWDRLQGVGRMFDPVEGIVGLDFDGCLDDHGDFIAGHVAAQWVPRLNSYTEVSPSGRGVKVWLLASHDLDGKAGRRDSKQGVEIYRERRYFTLTGQWLKQFSRNVEARQPEVAEFYRTIFGVKKPANTKTVTPKLITQTDAETIRRAVKAKNGGKFRALWAGSLDGYPKPYAGGKRRLSKRCLWAAGRLCRCSGCGPTASGSI